MKQHNDAVRTLTTCGETPVIQARFKVDESAMTHVARMLRNFYKDPIRTVVQEYVANAVDAHKMAGEPIEAIQVSLPNSMSPMFQVADVGGGLSPEQTEHLLYSFGASGEHKRTGDMANKQIGGFGLGAKCAFAVTDQFTYTIVWGGQRRVWRCFLDEHDDGKAELVSVEPDTATKPGVTIAVPVKSSEYSKCDRSLVSVCEYFVDGRPTVAGSPDFWKTSNNLAENRRVILKGAIKLQLRGDAVAPVRWKLVECPASSSTYRTYGELYVIQGRQAFEVTETDAAHGGMAHIEKTAHLTSTRHKRLELHCDIGTFPLTPSRESLQYSTFTKQLLEHVVKQAVAPRLKKQVDTMMEDSKLSESFVNLVSAVGKLEDLVESHLINDRFRNTWYPQWSSPKAYAAGRLTVDQALGVSVSAVSAIDAQDTIVVPANEPKKQRLLLAIYDKSSEVLLGHVSERGDKYSGVYTCVTAASCMEKWDHQPGVDPIVVFKSSDAWYDGKLKDATLMEEVLLKLAEVDDRYKTPRLFNSVDGNYLPLVVGKTRRRRQGAYCSTLPVYLSAIICSQSSTFYNTLINGADKHEFKGYPVVNGDALLTRVLADRERKKQERLVQAAATRKANLLRRKEASDVGMPLAAPIEVVTTTADRDYVKLEWYDCRHGMSAGAAIDKCPEPQKLRDVVAGKIAGLLPVIYVRGRNAYYDEQGQECASDGRLCEYAGAAQRWLLNRQFPYIVPVSSSHLVLAVRVNDATGIPGYMTGRVTSNFRKVFVEEYNKEHKITESQIQLFKAVSFAQYNRYGTDKRYQTFRFGTQLEERHQYWMTLMKLEAAAKRNTDFRKWMDVLREVLPLQVFDKEAEKHCLKAYWWFTYGSWADKDEFKTEVETWRAKELKAYMALNDVFRAIHETTGDDEAEMNRVIKQVIKNKKEKLLCDQV